MRQTKILRAFGLLAVLLAALLVWNVNAGSVNLSLGETLRILLRQSTDPVASRIVWNIRLPRILAAAMLGGALSVSGFLLQTFFANPIAGPFVLGISSGAKLTVALCMILLLQRGLVMNSAAMVAAAFAGSLAAMGFILLISRRVHSMSLLVVGGIMVGYICSAITDFAVTFADDSNIVNLHNWSMGSFSGMSWANVRDIARPISFVGIAVPHLMKRLLGTAKPLVLIPACFLGGAAFCLFCDLLARTLFAPTELSISSVTAVFGAPVVIFMMLNRHDRERGGMG